MPEIFGHLPGGEPVHRIQISSPALSVRLLTLGAAIQDVCLTGTPWPLTLGSEQLSAYLAELSSFGVIVGPVANRISGGKVRVGARTHQVPLHDGPFSLHSGPDGTQAQLWSLKDHGPDHAEMVLQLEDGACGLPGQRNLTARFGVQDTCLSLTLRATTTTTTPINLANHSYWNLDGTGDASGHLLRIDAEAILETNDAILPTGRLSPVQGTHFDHRTLSPFRPATDRRYDNCYCVSDHRRALSPVAQLRGQKGVTLDMSTTEPGLQVFDAGTISSGPHIGLTGQPYRPFCGIALEAQGWPDATSQPAFPSVMVNPEEVYEQITEWRFERVA